MPIWTGTTTRAALPLPLGNELRTRAAFNEHFVDVDTKGAWLNTANTFSQGQTFGGGIAVTTGNINHGAVNGSFIGWGIGNGLRYDTSLGTILNSSVNVTINLDSNNDQTDRTFIIRHNASDSTGPALFTVVDNAPATLALGLTIAAGGVSVTGAATFANNIGVGVTPAAWHANFKAVQLGSQGSVFADTAGSVIRLASNTYHDGTNQRSLATATAAQAVSGNGAFTVETAPSATAGGIQTFTPRLTVANTGLVTVASGLTVAAGGITNTTGDINTNAGTGFGYTFAGSVFNGLVYNSSNGPFINSSGGVNVNLDSNNDNTGMSFVVAHNGSTYGGGTPLFTVPDNAPATFALGINLTGTMALPRGMAAAPTLYFDTGNGFWSAGANRLNFATSGLGRAEIDAAGNLGVGVTPAAWGPTHRALQIGAYTSLWGVTSFTQLGNNTYEDAGGSKAITTGVASKLVQDSGAFFLTNAPSVAGNAAQTFVERMRLDAAGNLGVGVVPRGWGNQYNAIQVGREAAIWGAGGTFTAKLTGNSYFDNSVYRSIVTGPATRFEFENGLFSFATVGSVTAGNTQTFIERMRVDAAGQVGVGRVSASVSPDFVEIALGQAASWRAPRAGIGWNLLANSYLDASSVNRAVVTGPGGQSHFSAVGDYYVFTAATATAGGAQTMVERLRLANTGTVTLAPDVGQNALVALGNLGVGVAPEATWIVGINTVRVGGLGALMANAGGATDPASTTVAMMHNGYFAAGGISLLQAGRLGLAQIGFNGDFKWYTSAVGGAGSVATLIQRMQLGTAGTLSLNPDASQATLLVGSGMGIGVRHPMNPWHPTYGAIDLPGGSIFADTSAANRIEIASNHYINAAGTAVAAVGTIPGCKLQLYGGQLYYHTYAQVAGGAAQTQVTRLSINTAGTVALSPTAGQAALVTTGDVSVTGNIATLGANAGFNIADRGGGGTWVHYNNTNALRWWFNTDKMVLSPLGILNLYPDAGQSALIANGPITVADGAAGSFYVYTRSTSNNGDGTAQLYLARTSPTVNSQRLSFAGGIGYDYIIERKANSDDLVFSTWSGAALTERFRFSTAGVLTADSIGINSLNVNGSVAANIANTTGAGFILGDDGDIVDNNDTFATMRFNGGVRVTSAKNVNTIRHELTANGNAWHAANLTVMGLSDFGNYLDVPVITSPGNPGATRVRFFAKSDGLLYRRTNAGVEAVVGSAPSRTIAAESLTPINGCDPVYRDTGGTGRYEMVYAPGIAGHASINLTIPQNFIGGTVRFKLWSYSGGTQTVTWRLGGAALASGANADQGWGPIVDVAVTLNSMAITPVNLDWAGIPAAYAGTVMTVYFQVLTPPSSNVHLRAVDVLFGL